MATLAAVANGNLTSSSSWAVCDATSLLNSETGSDILTTAYSGTRSSAFTPGAIQIDGIGVRLATRTGTTGTISVQLELDSDNSAVAGTEVTINTADLPVCASITHGGWIFFKFASPVTLSAATAYQVAAKTSSASMVNLGRDGTTDNLSRYLRTTTTQAPTTGDNMIITKEWTAAGTGTARTITMNETAATDYGSADTTQVVACIAISQGGTLNWGTTAATAYLLRSSGSVVVYSEGVYSQGTTGTPIPRDSTAILEFDCAADGDFGLIGRNGSSIIIQGLSRTSGKNIVQCKLNTDEAANQTTLGVDTDTGWLDNDEIVVATTTRTISQSEKGALNGNAGGSSLTVDGFAGAGGGLANAHSGTSPTQAEVGLLTRNTKVRSVSSTAMCYVQFGQTGTVDIDWCEFRYLGENATGKRGLDINTQTGSCNIQYCSIYDVEDGGINMQGFAATVNNIVFSNNVCYNLNNANPALSQLNIIASSGPAITIENNLFITVSTSSGGTAFSLSTYNLTFNGNTLVGLGGAGVPNAFIISGTDPIVSFDNNTIHTSASLGLALQGNNVYGIIRGLKIWRNNSTGLTISTPAGGMDLKFEDAVFFGNGTRNINIPGSTVSKISFKDSTFNSDATFSTTTNIEMSSQASLFIIELLNCAFSQTTAATNDIHLNGSPASPMIYAFNTTFGAATELLNQTNLTRLAFFKSNKHDGNLNNTKSLYKYGTITAETTTRHTASGYSWKMTPNLATGKLIFPGPGELDSMKAAVAGGSAVTITVYVYEDGSYNGNRARLVLRGGLVAGIDDDVIDVATSASDTAWEQLSVTATPSDNGVLEFYVDCDGTAGNLFVDDVAVSQ